MTDNRTTELLREGLTERGVEWRSGLEGVTFVGDWCFVEYENGKLAATCEPVLTPDQAIAATLGSDRHPYEQRITGDGSNWCEIMRDAYDGLMANACESCTPEQMEQLVDHIRAELGSELPYDELIRCLENDWNISASWDGLRKFWCIELTEEGVKLRDAVHGKLTAEQVWRAVDPRSVCVPEKGDKEWQAIADELNAERHVETCRITASSTDGLCSDNPRHYFELSCGHSFTINGLDAPIACAVCGKVVKNAD